MLRIKWFDDTADSKPEIDPRLENVVNRMFERCFGEHKFQQAAGIALETRRIDLLERAIQESVRAPVNNHTSVIFEGITLYISQMSYEARCFMQHPNP